MTDPCQCKAKKKDSKEVCYEGPKEFTTVSGAEIKELYSPKDITPFNYDEKLGNPGEYPFTRGVYKDMYRGRTWTKRLFSGFGTAHDTNERYHYLLEHGQTGLSVAFDFPTLMGYDSDNNISRGEVGRCGVAIDSLADMETLFKGIPLDKVTTSMTINPPAAILLAMYIVVAEKQGVSKDKIGGTIQNDMLKEFIAQKTFMCPPRESVRLIVDTIEYCTKHVPRWNTISISGYHIREAGSTAVQELAFTIRDGIEYVDSAIKRGLDVDDFAQRLSFFFNSHMDFFEEVAKFRAARRMWANIMKNRFHAKNPKSWLLRFHTQTAGCSLTAQQPYNNVIRTAYQGLSAVLGGTQSLHTNSLDEVLALPTKEAATIALRTQQIIEDEIGVINTIDPLAGSYFVEALTNKMEEEAYRHIKTIDDMGGMISAIEAGYPQKEIADAAYKYQKDVESGKKIVVGVNKYVHEKEAPIELLELDEEAENKQTASLEKVKAARNAEKVKEALIKLGAAAKGSENTMPHIINAVREYATLQEICDVFRTAWGVYRDPGYF
ncbi:MAG: methylmalonyl-CoA mutase [Deltaproteobacteria bacterium CG11_big_fil_rev_8_21_14_0_20_49_13]|nr:MAG: methylmalonyl-CoA mutase [Deltaproteobacteria bacterium CG11_big_fil_rev_8_21_14_0_20_49_13]